MSTVHSEAVVVMLLLVALNELVAIPCEFQFESSDQRNKQEINLEKYGLKLGAAKSQPDVFFSCEEIDDEFFTENTKSYHVNAITTDEPQYVFSNSESDDTYEDIEPSCEVRRRTIQPHALNNIYNELIKVVNTASFIQSIRIEQCLNKKEACNDGTNPPRGKKHICRQKHVQITLKAFKNDSNMIADEQFYYPSHCVCELVTVKKRENLKQKCLPIFPFVS